ncbi:ABC transporter ATP-binding protein [Parapusillimonas granuli]|uniref:ABC transporter ATP-binding protein n=1 Tax=Parapusillimonas granuli TaxID=380911 RepID=A0A853G254_9BURK|nr:ABC transporter ATP-binding protein [Parapusillimonas granuli]MBB5214304.1 branched-chain amino acid transport system ATP-binding protein [Parapusillimonas granuli]NYT51408.1 ABC transporter ATP-binding protein [Parapusillimonas granuli]
MNERARQLLRVDGLTLRYGAGPVVHGISLGVEQGTVAALLGANGAGKSSTLRAIAGLEPAQGRVLFDGRDVSGWSAARRFRLGIVYVPEGRAIVADLTVAENLILGSYYEDARTRGRRREMVLEFFPEIANRLKSPAGLLSGGEQQMLAIGRALMAGPRLLLLDEPSLGLAPLLVARVYERLAAIQKDQNLTALLVEQSFHVAARLAARAWVLRHGHVAGELDAEALRSREGRQRAIDAYLGARQETGHAVHA